MNQMAALAALSSNNMYFDQNLFNSLQFGLQNMNFNQLNAVLTQQQNSSAVAASLNSQNSSNYFNSNLPITGASTSTGTTIQTFYNDTTVQGGAAK